MKKSLLSALVLTGVLASTQAVAAPAPETFYLGAKAGWSQFHDGLKQFKEDGARVTKDGASTGIFAGYQLTDHFAVELGYDYFGKAKGSYGEGDKMEHRAHGAQFTLKGSYPIIDGLDVYGRAGVALVRSDYKQTDGAGNSVRGDRLEGSAVFAGGVEYSFTDNFAARVEYQWLNNVGSARRAFQDPDLDYRPDIGTVSLGVSYRFGAGKPAPAPMKDPEYITKNFAFNSDVLFNFDKHNLKPEGVQALDNMQSEIQNIGMTGQTYQVSGFTDRLGSEAYNMRLSQKRAETVADHLVSRGVAPQTISATGYGKSNPVTGNACDHVKGRKALIACLAPDRRVEVQVQGTKTVVEQVK